MDTPLALQQGSIKPWCRSSSSHPVIVCLWQGHIEMVGSGLCSSGQRDWQRRCYAGLGGSNRVDQGLDQGPVLRFVSSKGLMLCLPLLAIRELEKRQPCRGEVPRRGLAPDEASQPRG